MSSNIRIPSLTMFRSRCGGTGESSISIMIIPSYWNWAVARANTQWNWQSFTLRRISSG